jgi:transposase
MFFRAKSNGYKKYLVIVENERVKDKVCQRVLCNIGRLDILQENGSLDSLLRSGLNFSDKLYVLDAQSKGEITETRSRRIGPGLLLETIWRCLGMDQVIRDTMEKRRIRFSVERAVFLTVLHRLFCPGSDRAAEKWKRDYKFSGCEDIGLHHLYRAMGWLGEMLPREEQDEISPFIFRCTKDKIEEELFFRTRNLFTDLQLVFFDTTSIYFEGIGGDTIGQYGHSKDHRPDLHQIVVGVVLDGEGNPICTEILPGDITDVKILIPVAQRLQKRFGIEKVCIVADRGMISGEVLLELEKMHWQYILGARMRRNKEVSREVLLDEKRYHVVRPPRRHSKEPSPLKVKEVKIEERRYIVCHNVEQAEKDRHDREAILASLQEALKQGNKSLVGNKGYRRYLKSSDEAFTIDEDKIREEVRYDGTWVLQTNTELPMDTVALKYMQLWMVEEIFRTMKSTLETRPIYHKRDETITGHVFCSFLALKVRSYLQGCLEKRNWKLEWKDIIQDVNELCEMEVAQRGKRFTVRSETKGVAGKVFQAVGVQLPPTISEIETVHYTQTMPVTA